MYDLNKSGLKPRVLHIITGLNVGGAERFLHTLVTGKLRDSFDNQIISLMDLGHYGRLLKAEGIEVYTLCMSSGRPSLKSLHRARKIVDAVQPDMIQGWMYHGNLLSELVAKKRPTIWNIRQTLYDLARERRSTQLVIRAGKALSKRPVKVIYNSELSQKQHESFGFAKRGLVISNGFSPDKWKPNRVSRSELRREIGVKQDTKIVGYVGRFHPMKDMWNLSTACKGILEKEDDVHIVVVGRELTPQNLELPGSMKEGQFKRIHFLGQRDDIDKIMPAFDLCCLTSRWGEGFPNVLGEAMLSGVPCVSTDVGDAARVIGAFGKVVPIADPNALADAAIDIIRLRESERLKLGKMARKHMMDEFSLEAITEQYRQLYTTVIEGM